MVKPALPYLDVLADVRSGVDVPVWAYQVSGEYAMIEAAAAHGWIDGRGAMLEALLGDPSGGRGRDPHLWAVEAAGWLRDGL